MATKLGLHGSVRGDGGGGKGAKEEDEGRRAWKGEEGGRGAFAGVAHMNLGIIMSLFNQVYFRDSLSTYCEFIPQMIFLNALFGYLCLLIVVKWVTGSTADLYHILIYMFLSPGEAGLTCNGTCKENIIFPGQSFIQARLPPGPSHPHVCPCLHLLLCTPLQFFLPFPSLSPIISVVHADLGLML